MLDKWHRYCAYITPGDKDRIVLVKDANETVNKTASLLYAFITPFATTVTGYFFISSGTLLARKNDRDSISMNRYSDKSPTQLKLYDYFIHRQFLSTRL